MPDLFTSLPRLTSRVIVAGAGLTLGSALRVIPEQFRGCSIIACNYAICAPWPEPENVWWLCNDYTAVLTDWWREALGRANPRRIIWSEELAAAAAAPDPPRDDVYKYTLGLHLMPGAHKHCLLPGELRGGASVVGLAAQLAWQCWRVHGRHQCQIQYAGADMRGNGYWDGSSQPRYRADHWRSHRDSINALNRWLLANGVAISSITETAMEVGCA